MAPATEKPAAEKKVEIVEKKAPEPKTAPKPAPVQKVNPVPVAAAKPAKEATTEDDDMDMYAF